MSEYGFLYQEQTWSLALHGVGFTALVLLWAYYLMQIGHQRWLEVSRTVPTP